MPDPVVDTLVEAVHRLSENAEPTARDEDNFLAMLAGVPLSCEHEACRHMVMRAQIRVKSRLLPTPEMAAVDGPNAVQGARAPRDSFEGMLINDRYRIESCIGSGGMSRMYACIDTMTDVRVAIKLFNPELSRLHSTKQRLLSVARTMMNLQSTHIVRALDVGALESGQLYVVMEYLYGVDLETLLRSEGPIAWPRVAAMALQICKGLATAHRRGIIHQDIKPQNCFRILVDDDNPEHIKVIDFGVAEGTRSEVGPTLQSFLFGSPAYTAPELVARRAKPDARTDIYSLGVTMYKLLTGRLPFQDSRPMEVLRCHVKEQPLPPSKAAPDREIPAEADRIVLQALRKEPAARYASVGELIRALKAALGPTTAAILSVATANPPASSAPHARTPPPARAHARSPSQTPPPAAIQSPAARAIPPTTRRASSGSKHIAIFTWLAASLCAATFILLATLPELETAPSPSTDDAPDGIPIDDAEGCAEGESCRECDCASGLVCHHNRCVNRDRITTAPLVCQENPQVAAAMRQIADMCAKRKKGLDNIVSSGSCSVADWEALALNEESFDLMLAAFPNRFAVHFPNGKPSRRRDWPSKTDRDHTLTQLRAYRGPLTEARQIFVIGRASPDGDPQANNLLALSRMNLVSDLIRSVIFEGIPETERDVFRLQIRPFAVPTSRPILPERYINTYLANPTGTTSLALEPLVTWDPDSLSELKTRLADQTLLAKRSGAEYQSLFNAVNRVVLVIPIPCLGDEYVPPSSEIRPPTGDNP